MTRQSDPVCHTSDSSACEFVNIDYVPGIELECGQVLPEHISVPVLMSDPTFVEFDLEDVFSADTVQATYAVDGSTDFAEHGYACTRELSNGDCGQVDHMYTKTESVKKPKHKLASMQKRPGVIKSQKCHQKSIAHAVKCKVSKAHRSSMRERHASVLKNLCIASANNLGNVPMKQPKQLNAHSKRCKGKFYSCHKWSKVHETSVKSDTPSSDHLNARHDCGQ